MHWMTRFWIPVDMEMVKFAKKMLDNPLIEHSPIPLGFRYDGDYTIKDVMVMGYSVKDSKTEKGYVDKGAIVFSTGDGLIQLGLSYYPSIKFSIPKTNLKSYETEEKYKIQTIIISEWAYNNCFMLAVNKLYEDWGGHMKSLLDQVDSRNWNDAPMNKYSPYRELIEKIYSQQFKERMKNYKKKKGIAMENGNGNKPEMVQQKRSETTIQSETKSTISNGNKSNGNNNAIKNRKKTVKKVNGMKQAPFRKEAEWIFYTDGSGNLAKEKKTKANAHFSVFLKNSEEKWKRKEEALTSNQAELLGVMSAISIAMKRQYKNVTIFTDSKNVVNWLSKKPDSDEYIFKARHPNVVNYVESCRALIENMPFLKIKYVKRDFNYAHVI